MRRRGFTLPALVIVLPAGEPAFAQIIACNESEADVIRSVLDDDATIRAVLAVLLGDNWQVDDAA